MTVRHHRCPECGRPVPTIFEHIDVDCVALPDPWEQEGDDAAIDRWNAAALAAMRGQPCPADDDDSRLGYTYGLNAAKVVPVMPKRAEGYYHTNPNGEA